MTSKTILVVGASRGLGRAFIDGLGQPEDRLVGVSRQKPTDLPAGAVQRIRWIEADLSEPKTAVSAIRDALAGETIDVLIYNVGLWEAKAFTDEYNFLDDDDAEIEMMIQVNVTACILLLKALLPQLLQSTEPRLILTGSTSALDQNGRPEVTFTATKYALRGIASALREGYRDRGLTVTTLNLGYLNTDDPLSAPIGQALTRTGKSAVLVHDVVQLVQTLLQLSPAAWAKDITMPATDDDRF